jgi:predicted PurR-regulated permease PerM
MSSRSWLGLLSLIVLGLLAWELRWVLLVLFGAVVLAVALDVPVSWLRRVSRLNRPAALAIVLALILVGGWKLSELLLPELLQQVNQLTQLVPTLVQRLGRLVGGFTMLESLEQQLQAVATWDKLQPIGALVLAATPNSYRPLMGDLLRECREALGGWLAGMTISASTVFVLTWAGLAALQVPLALLSALVCGLLTFVPTIGPTVASLLPLAVALLVSPAKVLQVLILRLALQNGEAFLLTPLLLSRTVNLLPTVALMAQLSLGALLGLPGVLLALPLVVVLQVVMEKVVVEQVMDRW